MASTSKLPLRRKKLAGTFFYMNLSPISCCHSSHDDGGSVTPHLEVLSCIRLPECAPASSIHSIGSSSEFSTLIILSHRKINKSSSTVDDPAILKLPLTKPPVKKIDLHFPLGMEVTARNLKGVTIKDALDAIHKSYKKRVCFNATNRNCAT